MTQCYFEIVASRTDQPLQGLTVGDERNNASHQLSSWSGKLALPTTFPFSPCTGMEETDIGRALLSSDHVFIPWRGANMSCNGGKMALFSSAASDLVLLHSLRKIWGYFICFNISYSLLKHITNCWMRTSSLLDFYKSPI